MILWFYAAAIAGLIGSVLFTLTRGRFGTPKKESALAFFARVAKELRPAGEISLPGAVDGRNEFGVPITRRVRPELRWRKVPSTPDLPFEVFEASKEGGPLPTGPILVTAPAVSAAVPGPAYALQGDIAPYIGDLQDRWFTYRAFDVPQRANESVAAQSAARASETVVAGYVPSIAGRGPIAARRLPANELIDFVQWSGSR